MLVGIAMAFHTGVISQQKVSLVAQPPYSANDATPIMTANHCRKPTETAQEAAAQILQRGTYAGGVPLDEGRKLALQSIQGSSTYYPLRVNEASCYYYYTLPVGWGATLVFLHAQDHWEWNDS